MRKQWKRDLLLGALGYPALEVAWRGRTHWTMALAGGMAAVALRRISGRHRRRPLWRQALRGGLAITGIEYAIGRLFNRRHRIWDYRKMPLNLQGQVCLSYTACWCVLSGLVLSLMRGKL